MHWTILYVILNFYIASSVAGNYTFTHEMAMQCKEHISRHGYAYDTYYNVNSDARRKVNIDPKNDFEMHIAILAASNGHILLSTTLRPSTSDPVYEIVIGGGNNKFTELRRNLRRNARSSAKTVGILSAIEYRPFYIRISKDGLIEFGKEGEDPLLSYYDLDPLTIGYFSFASWQGVDAKFLYDCPVADKDGIKPSTTDSKEEEPRMSNSDRLKRTLLLDRIPSLPPATRVTVDLGIKVTSVKYDAVESRLSTAMAVVVSWTDDSMAWNPNKFYNMTRLKFRQGQIWRPTFHVLNSDENNVLESRNMELISMVNSGEAMYHFQTIVKTWCYINTNASSWPRDEYSCSIVIAPWEAHEKINITKIPSTDEKMQIYKDIDDVMENEWEYSVKQVVVAPDLWNQILTSYNQTHQSDRLVIKIILRRHATTYNLAFYTPMLVLVSFVLISFWTEALKLKRIWFYAGCTVVICMGMCYVDSLVPTHTVPSIMILYTTVLGGVLLALIIHVLLMTNSAERLCKNLKIQNVLSSPIFRSIFCLSQMKTCKRYESINEGYFPQDDDTEAVLASTSNGDIEEMQAENKAPTHREELTEAVDKFLFIVYSIVFAIMLGCHF